MKPFIDLAAQGQVVKSEVLNAFSEIIDHAAFIGGKYVERCEQSLTDYIGRRCLVVSSGTDALVLALMALDLCPGDVVFVPSFTFAASAEAVALLGGVPYFVDVGSDYNMSVGALSNAWSDAKRRGLQPVGIISVDLFGLPADHDAIEHFASQEDLWVINDAAQSFGSLYQGESALKRGVISTTSFFPAKPLGCWGDGGAVFVDDDALYEKMASLRCHGQGAMRYTYQHVGINARMDAMQCAVILSKLKIFDAEVEKRVRIADRYNTALKDLAVTPLVPEGRTSVYAQYTLLLQPEVRDQVQKALAESGIPSVIYYPIPIHQQNAYKHFPAGDMSNTTRFCQSVLSLPMHPYLSEVDQDQIITGFKHIHQAESAI
ncbi:DegT/DnrJ/EryC1/StrS family aminotransferase [Gammaproteobacteria bacterium]|nr:DegT/DnrJ/EryC1/StrS family aminotransferase [Gammaproteobacteria bacterium]